MSRSRLLLALAFCSMALADGGASTPIDPNAAIRCFHEARALSDREGGRLWGKPLYGPMLFVESDSRRALANAPDGRGILQPSGDSWEGQLPEGVLVANTATDWAEVHWTMVMWPLPEDGHARQKLMMHECFHRIQKDLGLTFPERPCGHLDSKDGRLWLQLEWRALAAAMLSHGKSRRMSIQDALCFRAHRRSLFPEAAEAERGMEMNEGLAEYTGVCAAARTGTQALLDALVALEAGPRKPTFVRSFAYASGPVYGLLLDAQSPGWRRKLTQRSDLGDLLGKSAGISTIPIDETRVSQRASKYGLHELDQDEVRRDQNQKARVTVFRARLVEGPVLILPRSGDFNYSFNPNNLVALGDQGVVYPTLQATGPWGKINASQGALMTNKDLRVPAPVGPHPGPLKGEGWFLDLAPGWVLEPGPRKGDFKVIQAAPKVPSQ